VDHDDAFPVGDREPPAGLVDRDARRAGPNYTGQPAVNSASPNGSWLYQARLDRDPSPQLVGEVLVANVVAMPLRGVDKVLGLAGLTHLGEVAAVQVPVVVQQRHLLNGDGDGV
jgi:hypothetical protein